MTDPEKRRYFDQLASRWDGFTDHIRVRAELRKELRLMRPAEGERVVDLGCGTGNLTAALLEELGPEGRITAVDFSQEMVATARRKLPDARVRWCIADAAELPLAGGEVDRVICFSAWPHFPNPSGVAREMFRVLCTGGMLAILHIDGRGVINQIHSSAGGPIAHDRLPAADELASLLKTVGFHVEECVDEPHRFLVTARKPLNDPR